MLRLCHRSSVGLMADVVVRSGNSVRARSANSAVDGAFKHSRMKSSLELVLYVFVLGLAVAEEPFKDEVVVEERVDEAHFCNIILALPVKCQRCRQVFTF